MACWAALRALPHWALPACRARAAVPALPSAPVSLNVIDVAGQLQLVQRALETFASQNPKLISHINFSQAPAPELPGKIKAQQNAGQMDIDLVLTGTDALSAGIEQKLWVPVARRLRRGTSRPAGDLSAGGLEDAGSGARAGRVHGVLPGRPAAGIHARRGEEGADHGARTARLHQAESEPLHLCAPGQFRARPQLAQGLPYLLGDKDPKDPKDGWDKTWAYLAELGKNIEYYPTGTGAVMKELGEGSRDMTVTMTGWDINPRVLGMVPKEAEIGV